MCLSQLQSCPMAASCIFTLQVATFPRGLGAFGGFFDSLIATLNINDLQSDQFQPHFFFFSNLKPWTRLWLFFCSLCSDLSTLRYRRKRTPDGPVTRPRSWLLYSRAQNYMWKKQKCVTYKSLLTLGHKQNTNFNLQRERPLYDPSNWLNWHKRGTQDPTGLRIDYNTPPVTSTVLVGFFLE